MPNNFKLTGDYYVSIDGSDSNNGLTKDTPKRTVQAGLNLLTTNSKTLIIGAGVYKETISSGPIVINGINVYCDGQVIFEGNGTNNFAYGRYGSCNWYGGIWRNYAGIYFYFGGAFQGSYSTGILDNTLGVITLGTIYSGVKIINGGIFVYGSDCGVEIVNSIIINSTIDGTRGRNSIKNSYINSTSILNCLPAITTTNFNYNNIQGSIIMNSATSVTTGVYQDIYGRYYDLSITTSTGDGTIGTPYGRPYTNGAAFSFTNHRILYPTYNVNSFSSDPKFNDIQAQDFTLQITSPHIGRASDGTNIGGTKYATRYSAKGSEFNTSAVSVSGLAFVGNDWTVSGGTTGEVVSAPILISSTTKVLQKISYNGLLEFNKLVTGGTAGNRNVPDQDIYTAGTQGANPDRLVYYLRYSTQSAQPATNAEWDNGGYWTAGNYGVFEWNTKPSIDNAFLGNGDPAFNSGVTATFLNATWIQLKVKLRNNYA